MAAVNRTAGRFAQISWLLRPRILLLFIALAKN
jgi:hypothetical protein